MTDGKPSRFSATPAEIDAFLRREFCEDTLLHFYQAAGDEVLDEALCHGSAHHARLDAAAGHFKHLYLSGMVDVMEEMRAHRYYPAKLPDLSSYNRPHTAPPEGPAS